MEFSHSIIDQRSTPAGALGGASGTDASGAPDVHEPCPAATDPRCEPAPISTCATPWQRAESALVQEQHIAPRIRHTWPWAALQARAHRKRLERDAAVYSMHQLLSRTSSAAAAAGQSASVAHRAATTTSTAAGKADSWSSDNDAAAIPFVVSDDQLRRRILTSTATELLWMMNTGEATSLQITTACIQQCCQVGHELGALAEENFKEALRLASDSDDRRRRLKLQQALDTAAAAVTSASASAGRASVSDHMQPTSEPSVDLRSIQFGAAGSTRSPESPPSTGLGVLEGLPISVKDEYEQDGFDATCGLTSLCFRPFERDGGLLASLRSQGAIPFVRSNLPQLVMSSETNNHLWGRCDNPWSRDRTPGGSSGGEGALISSFCSPLGIGSDIAGSVRIPAQFCGICAFRPTPERVTLRGLAAVSPGEEGQHLVVAAPGPMARCVDDLVLVMRSWLPEADPTGSNGGVRASVAAQQPTAQEDAEEARGKLEFTQRPLALWDVDVSVPHLPFDLGKYGQHRPLCIGWYTTDHFFEPAPPCTRAVHESVAALQAAGHKMVHWDPADHGVDLHAASLAYCVLVGKDSINDSSRHLGAEPLHGLYRVFKWLAMIPDVIRPGLSQVLQSYGWPRIAEIVRYTHSRTMLQSWEWNAKRNAAKDALVDAMRRDGIELLLTPALGTPAWKHGHVDYLEAATSYAWVWNYFHFPAGVVPVTHVRNDECRYTCPPNERDPIAAAAQECMLGAAGLPVGVQLAGLPLQEETVLRGMRELETALKQPRARTGGVGEEAAAAGLEGSPIPATAPEGTGCAATAVASGSPRAVASAAVGSATSEPAEDRPDSWDPAQDVEVHRMRQLLYDRSQLMSRSAGTSCAP